MTELKEEFEKLFESLITEEEYEVNQAFIEIEGGADIKIWSWIEQKIDEACKKQREICANQFTTEKDFIYDLGTFKNDISEDGKFNEAEFDKMLDYIYKFIKLAPSPKESE